jgi:DNA-binding NarL/FixJ family response regulator
MSTVTLNSHEVVSAANPAAGAEPVCILLVDDEPRNLDALESILSSPEYQLLRAESAEQALMMLIENEVAVIVLDIRMPGTSGLELAQIIKQRKKSQDIPIIFLTAYYQEDEQILHGYKVGAVDYLTKPANPFILRSKVAVFVDLYRANRRLQREVLQRRQTEESLQAANTELRLMTDRLRALAAELTQTEQRERKRLAGLLHDHLQQLLVGALMKLQTINGYDDSLQRKIENATNILRDAIESSRSLTVELSPPVLSQSGLKAGLVWLAGRFEEKFTNKISVEAGEHAEPLLESTRLFLFDAARELLFNAIKHSGSEIIRLNLDRTPKAWIQLCVEDYGKGFDQSRIETAKGTGFGLFSIQQRLGYFGGQFQVESMPGKGTKTTILIHEENVPEAKGAQTIVTTNKTPDYKGVRGAAGKKIGVVLADDHPIVLQGLKGLLESEADMQVLGEASDGLEAVRLALELKPDLLVMDVTMPGLNGIEAARIISQDMPSIKVIGLSMHSDSEVCQAMRQAGAAAYLPKGGLAKDLLAAIRACCSDSA